MVGGAQHDAHARARRNSRGSGRAVGGLDPGRGAAVAQQAYEARAHSGFELGDQAFVVADAERCAGLVDGAANVLDADDLEVKVEVARANPDARSNRSR